MKRGAVRGRTAALGRAVVIISVAAISVLGYLAQRLYEDAAALRAAPQDNVQWSLSRLEVETLRLAEFPNLLWVTVEDEDGQVGKCVGGAVTEEKL